MEAREIFKKMYDRLGHGNFENNGGEEFLQKLIKGKTLEESIKLLAELFMQRFDTGKPDDLEWLLKEILKVKPELASVDLPYNHIFFACVYHGCFDLYRGFVESGIEVLYKDKPNEEKTDCYFNLSLTALKVSDDLFPKYNQYFRGMHYNSAFARQNEEQDILLIHEEDVAIYENIVKEYNSIIGRRKIIDDLNKRAEIDNE